MTDIIENENGNGNLEVEKKTWRNRTKMAWVSLISMVLITYLILFTNLVPESRLKILSEVITWYYLGCVSIIGAFMGFKSWVSRK